LLKVAAKLVIFPAKWVDSETAHPSGVIVPSLYYLASCGATFLNLLISMQCTGNG